MLTTKTSRILLLLLIAPVFFSASSVRAQPVDSTLYKESPFSLKTPTGTLAGTLCMPSAGGTVPIALIIPGSGPVDRDGNVIPMLKNDEYKILAHRLAVGGVASIRYDKRGVGESASAGIPEADLRFEHYINDARGWIDSLVRSHRFSRLIVVGHSEGSLIGMVASESLAPGAGKFVSIAGAGEKIDGVLRKQLVRMPDSLRARAYNILDSLSTGRLVDSIPSKLHTLFRKSVQPYLVSWMKFDPVAEIKKLRVPVLILQGTDDLQVDTTEAQRLAKSRPDAQLAIIPRMNHVFRLVEGDDLTYNYMTYRNPDLPIADALVERLLAFIKARD